MHTRSVFRRMSALTLVVTLSLVGIPRPTSAAGAEEVAAARHRGLTINGQPLSQFLGATATPRAIFPLAAFLRQGTGQIRGVAFDGDGHRVADGTVRLRQVPGQEAPPDPAAVDTTTTDASGRFSFAGLGQGQYVVDLLIAGQVVATSGPFSVAEGGMVFIQVGGVPGQQSTTDDRKGKGVLFWTTVGAGVGGALGLVAIAGAECEFPENLCPVVVGLGAVTGALMGLLFGL